MDNLKTILQEKEVQYEIIHHEKQIRTAQEGVDYFGIEIGQTAPTLVLSLPCIVDRGLFRYPFIYGGTGEPASTLKIVPNALEKIN